MVILNFGSGRSRTARPPRPEPRRLEKRKAAPAPLQSAPAETGLHVAVSSRSVLRRWVPPKVRFQPSEVCRSARPSTMRPRSKRRPLKISRAMRSKTFPSPVSNKKAATASALGPPLLSLRTFISPQTPQVYTPQQSSAAAALTHSRCHLLWQRSGLRAIEGVAPVEARVAAS